ncbi:probable serine/threonine-protein kinase PkwA isoform X1 [Choloepus didactylus]|uniref:probable serine/threonine-protein kinase PkwA isoform X1 n=1 Tax=Choloepus didactylus TaxID=27675 RepID=UPI0018A07BDF|nr:probable serine/threonine-protein kinase PkwA isoform X1 [Choloepus didactylus]
MGLSWGQWSPGSERPCSGGPVCVHRPSPWPLGVDFNWGPSSGSDPGTPDGFLWLLDRFLVCLGDSMSFRFEHHQDSLCYVCGVLEHLTGQARTWAAPNLEELFCQDLEEVIRDLSGFAMARESSQLSVVTQPPVLRQWLAPFSEALALGVRFLLGLPQPLQPPPLGLALTPLPQMPWTLHMVQVGGMWPAWPRTPVVPGQTVASPGAPTRHGSPPPAPARPPVRAPRRPVGRPRTAFLRGSPGPGTPAPALRVPARPGAHLEPADPEDGGHAGRPRGPVRDLAADAAPREPAPQVRVLEMPSKTPVCTLRTEAGARLGMPMSLRLWQANDRPLLLAGYEDGSVALWSVPERRAVSRAVCHPEPVLGLDFDPRGARGVSGSAGKALAVWSLDEQQTLKVCSTHELTNPGVADVVLRPDRKILATAGWDHRVRVFRWSTMKPLAVLDFHRASVHCVAFAANGLLAAGSGDERISVWDLYPNT